MSFWLLKTVNGHLLHEVVSALQKCIRRGLIDDALYFAVDMYLTGYAEYAWKRMRVIVSEDIGIADPHLPATFEALYTSAKELAKKKDGLGHDKLPFTHAVILLAQAPKSRMVANALYVHFEDHANLKRDIPDCARDMHTGAGKRLGRGTEHFYAESGVIMKDGEPINESLTDPYYERSKQIELVVERDKNARNQAIAPLFDETG